MHLARLILLLSSVLWFAAAVPVHAQEEGQQGNGFLIPFPPGDTYTMQVIGDTLADGILGGLVEAIGTDSRVKLVRKHRNLNSLMRPESEDELKSLEEAIAKEPFQIAVVMTGTLDRRQWTNPAGKRFAIGSDEWKAEYGRRIDRLMKIVRKGGVGVYWLSLPNLKRSDANDDAQMMNEIMREKAYLNGLRFIDSFAGFADEQGGYSDFGPDLTGKIRRLREADGINFTDPGNRKLAHFVERELKRDLTQAKQERNIPLAGDAAEQALINPVKAPSADASAPVAATPGASGEKAGSVAATIGAAAASSGDQKADNGRVSIKSAGANGREEVLVLDVLRPAIPASVVALVTRKESADKASQMGESLVDQIAGGVTVLSSITPANEAGGGAQRRKLSPTQSPYFRVLVKGERLAPRAGRADDLVWPRPEPAPVAVEPPKKAPVASEPAPQPEQPAAKPARKSRDKG